MYSDRLVDPNWLSHVFENVELTHRSVLDLGCGGGLYTYELSTTGAHVTGIDSSYAMLEKARNQYKPLAFIQSEASELPFNEESVDVILMRALTHHFTDLSPLLHEARRVLRSNGQLIIQNRTEKDCFLPGSAQHVRGYLYERFPHLKQVEIDRRHSSTHMHKVLTTAGFHSMTEQTFWEVRARYPNFNAFASAMRSRHGRSILHKLCDEELESFIHYVRNETGDVAIEDQDRWTVWTCQK